MCENKIFTTVCVRIAISTIREEMCGSSTIRKINYVFSFAKNWPDLTVHAHVFKLIVHVIAMEHCFYVDC